MDKLNETIVEALPVPSTRAKLYNFAGAKIQGSQAPRGFNVRITPAGERTYALRYWLGGVEHLYAIGRHPDWKPLNAVKEARALRQEIDRGIDPLKTRRKQEATEAGKDTVKAICEEWLVRKGGMKREADGNATFSGKLRSAKSRMQTFERLVYPAIGDKQVEECKRTDIVRMLDAIADENGERMADLTLAYLRKVLNWHAARSDDYRPPIVRGMAKQKPKEHQRDRTLNDNELRVVWQTADKLGTPFAKLIQFILLTGARRGEAADIPWKEIEGEDWTLAKERNKTKLDLVRPLPQAAVEVLPAEITRCQPRQAHDHRGKP